MKGIALTGIALKCAGANNTEEFLSLIRNAEVHTKAITEERINYSKVFNSENIAKFGFLDRVDQFDYNFFQISKAEADAMDPGHRLLLQSVCESIEKSGSSLEEFRTKKTGLFITTNINYYNFLYQSNNSQLDFLGNVASMSAGRIARFLNVRGPVLNIDTACSSSLVAICEAVKKLESGDIDIAIVGGARILCMFEDAESIKNSPILASDGLCRAFDDLANGTSGGEGVASIVLKRVEDAERDNDQIISVIKGSATNHDGELSTGLTAPSPISQKELITKAIKDSGVAKESIAYIETHGTGTKLGDPIEYKAIKEVFQDSESNYTIRLGTLKPNIGHLDNMSGMFGFIKASLAMKEKEFFPNANFNTLNTFIDADPNIMINSEGKVWDSKFEIRRAGVSSFGLSGTNAHIILEEYQEKESETFNKEYYWTKLSAKSLNSLSDYAKNIMKSFQNTELDLHNICSTLNAGRGDYSYGFSVSGENIDSLANNIQKKVNNLDVLTPRNQVDNIIFLLLSDDIDETVFNKIKGKQFKSFYKKISDQLVNIEVDTIKTELFQSSFYKYLIAKGIAVSQVICNGKKAMNSRSIIEQKFDKVDIGEETNSKEIDWDLFEKVLTNDSSKAIMLVSQNEKAKSELRRITDKLNISLIDVQDELVKGEEYFWSTLYNSGIDFNWIKFYKEDSYSKIELPTYAFEKIACWNNTINPLISQTPQSINLELKNSNDSLNKTLSKTGDVTNTVLLALKETLQNDEIKLNDDFFEIGGNSIVGIQFINRINEAYGIAIQFDDLYECYEINDIISLISNNIVSERKELVDVKVEDNSEEVRFPLINSQYRIWSDSQNIDVSISYNINMNLKLRGEVDVQFLENVLRQIIKDHTSFRLAFKIDNEGEEIYQELIPYENIDFTLDEIDVTKANKKTKDIIRDIYNTPFNLSEGPLFRASILKETEKEYTLVLSFHHIIFDGWSSGLFIQTLAENYLKLHDGHTVVSHNGFQYTDYISWFLKNMSHENVKTHKTYWNNKFHSEDKKFLFGDKKSNITNKGGKKSLKISKTTREGLNTLAKNNRTTLFVTLVSSLRSFLYKLVDYNIVIGTPTSGRVQRDFENVMGLFLNTLPLKTTINSDMSFLDVISLEKETVVEALKHEFYPYDAILEDLKEKGIKVDSLYNVMVVLQNQNNRSGLEISSSSQLPIEITKGIDIDEGYANLDLTFMFFDNEDALELEVDYNSSVFDSRLLDSVLKNYLYFLKNIIEKPKESLIDVDSTHLAEIEQVVHSFNEESINVQKDETVIDAFLEKVSEHPDKVALLIENNQYSYKEVDELSNCFANFLQEKYGLKENTVLTISLDRSEWFIIFVLGILKSGCTYIPVDPSYPEERKNYIFNNSKATLSIDEQVLDSFLNEKSQFENVYISKAKADETAYIIYTSGSTGNPKGVAIYHKALLNYIESSRDLFIQGEEDVFAFFSSISFDLTVTSIFTPLFNGNAIVIYSKDSNDLIKTIIEEDKATIIKLTPSHLKILRDSEQTIISTKTKNFIVGGEEFELLLAQKINEKFNGNVNIFNEYGPTEATVGCMIYKYLGDEQFSSLSIGKPIQHTQIYLLDENLNPVGIGMKGEMYISGEGLAKGYHNNLDLTEERFVSNPFIEGRKMYKTGDLAIRMPDGNITYKGRIDDQVKINGHRIELGEIENVLINVKEYVKDAVVVTKSWKGAKQLVAYIVPVEKGDESEFKLNIKGCIESILPDYMQPKFYIILDSFSLTVNGKIDKKKLPEINEKDLLKQKYVAPSNDTEKGLVEIWEEKLEISNVGILDNFFDLGGDSLLAVKLLAKVNAKFDTNFPLDILFHVENIKLLANYIDNGYTFNKDYYFFGNTNSENKIFAFPPILGYGTAYQKLFENYESAEVVSFNFLEESEDILETYAQFIQKIQPFGELTLFGMSAGGNLAYRVGKYMIEHYNRKVDHLIMFDSFAILKKDWLEHDYEHMYEYVKYDMGLENLMDNTAILRNARKKLYAYFDFHNGVDTYEEYIDTELSLVKSISTDYKHNWEGVFPVINTYQGFGVHFDMLKQPHLPKNQQILFNVINKQLHENI